MPNKRWKPKQKYIAFEDPLWPKPKECASTPSFRDPYRTAKFRSDPGGESFGDDSLPPLSIGVIDTKFNFVLYTGWKYGLVSLSDYLECNFDEHVFFTTARSKGPFSEPSPPEWIRQHLNEYGLPPLDLESDARKSKHFLVIRDPITRFVSGYREIMWRYYLNMRVQNKQQAGQGQEKEVPQEEESEEESNPFKMSGYNDAVRRSALNRWEDITNVTAFVHLTECGAQYPWWQHVQTRSAISDQMVPSHHPAPRVDVVLHTESLTEDVSKLEKHAASTGWEKRCDLDHGHSDSAKEGEGWDFAPSKIKILSALRTDPALMRSLCEVYAIDIVCFSQKIPEECASLFR